MHLLTLNVEENDIYIYIFFLIEFIFYKFKFSIYVFALTQMFVCISI